MFLEDRSSRLLGAQEGPGGEFILKYNLLGLCPVGSGMGLVHSWGSAGFEASRHQPRRTRARRTGLQVPPGAMGLGVLSGGHRLGGGAAAASPGRCAGLAGRVVTRAWRGWSAGGRAAQDWLALTPARPAISPAGLGGAHGQRPREDPWDLRSGDGPHEPLLPGVTCPSVWGSDSRSAPEVRVVH